MCATVLKTTQHVVIQHSTEEDEGLTLLQRFQKYVVSDFPIQRLVRVHTIAETAADIGYVLKPASKPETSNT